MIFSEMNIHWCGTDLKNAKSHNALVISDCVSRNDVLCSLGASHDISASI
jgi:hypothetical protein